MENLELKEFIKAQVLNTEEEMETSLSPKEEQLISVCTKLFDLGEYLRNSKGYVLGHAAFTK